MRRPEQGEAGVVYVSETMTNARPPGEHARLMNLPRDEEIYSPGRGFITQGCRRPCALGLAQAHTLTGEGNGSVLAWKIPWTEEPGGLQSMGSKRVEHN